MTKKLLVIAAVGALVSIACFFGLHAMGGFPFAEGGVSSWGEGPWRDGGPTVSRNLPFDGGERVEIAYPAVITVTQGDQPRFTVTGPQDVLGQLRLEDGVLAGPDGRPGFWWGRRRHGRVRIDIVSPNTHEFRLVGAEKLILRAFDQESLVLRVGGAADVEGQGKAKRLDVQLAGAGHLDLADLTVDEAEVSISGAGDASLDARTSADIAISGAGHVRLRCRPPAATSHVSGFGSVDYGADCAAGPPPASSTPPAAPAPSPKSKV